MNQFDNILGFKGTWRKYQQRVLDESAQYIRDGKIHVVAAPGAGKTTLGIELIRRTGKPCLILSPRIVIREQWLSRIRESFFIKDEPEGFLSSDIKNPGMITSITYQTLYSGMSRLQGKEKEEDSEQTENVDFSGFDLVKTVKDKGIGTICLDECHHLKNEWWKALEAFMENMSGVTVISLTATPPYDSNISQWERYISMCGDIDTEISIPELVKENSLCPHQDYVYFNYPTKEEEGKVKQFKENSALAYGQLLQNEEFANIIFTHRAITDCKNNADTMLENPAYIVSILSLCQYKNKSFDKGWLKLFGAGEMPMINYQYMAELLKGFLYTDTESFNCTEEFRKGIEKELKGAGVIDKKEISFTANAKIEKLLVNSCGKLLSICNIADTEVKSIGNDLRMLILTDYIRKEFLSSIGNEEKSIDQIGVLPIFELLRRNITEDKISVLCGSVVILPDSAVNKALSLCKEIDSDNTLTFEQLRNKEGKPLGYSYIDSSGKSHLLTAVVTQLFELGEIHILIGTKSLLGEGWDSPCVNSLILASFVGSYVLGNQMRGRAIRKDKNRPDKVSNIWHLVCLAGKTEKKENIKKGNISSELTEDFITLQRRMDGIIGLNYDFKTIENGIERLNLNPPFTKDSVSKINEDMKIRSADRKSVAEGWKTALDCGEQFEITNNAEANEQALNIPIFVSGIGLYIIFALMVAAEMFLGITQRMLVMSSINDGGFIGVLLTLMGIAILFLLLMIIITKLPKLLRFITPYKRLETIGKTILSAMKKLQLINSDCKVCAEDADGVLFRVYLKGGTDREKELFSSAVAQMLAPVDNQRYLLCRKSNYGISLRGTLCVPKVFESSREKVDILCGEMNKMIGKFTPVYTRNPEGRQFLLKARAKSFANKNEKLVTRKKRVKGNYYN